MLSSQHLSEASLNIPGIPHPSHTRHRVLVGWLAVALPILSSLITAYVPFFHRLPLLLHVLCVVGIAMYGGFIAAVLGAVISIFSNYMVLYGLHEPLWVTVVRCSTLFVIGTLVSLMNRHRRVTAETLEERTEELILSQQVSRSACWHYSHLEGFRWLRGGYEVFGISFDDVEALPSPVALIHPDDQQGVENAINQMVASDGTLHIEYRVVFPSGETRWSEARAVPIPGNEPAWRGVTTDVTERKQAEQALLRSEKLAAMGRLASTVAHEINNPLEAVTNLLYLARMDQSQSDEAKTYLATAEAELARLADITRLTLGFVRNSVGTVTVDPVTVIEDVLSIFRHRFDQKGLRIERHLEPGSSVRIAPHELRQIVTNLLSNAADAVHESSGRIVIRVEQRGSEVILQVEDNGAGIPAADLPRIFDPFFSTKDDVGTGIGLWVTRELVDKNAGTITAQSGSLANGMRTAFQIHLPSAG